MTSPASPPPGRDRGVRTLIVDDHELIAEALALALRMDGVCCSVADLTDRASVLRSAREDRPDVVLLDLDLGPAIGDGSLLVRPLVDLGCTVLGVTASTDRDQVCRTLEAGAVAVLSKNMRFDDLLTTVLDVAGGRSVLAPEERRQIIDDALAERVRQAEADAPYGRLSPRERHVLRRLAEGRTVASIATDDFVSEATVRTQVRAILTKLGVRSQLEAVALANRRGWLHD